MKTLKNKRMKCIVRVRDTKNAEVQHIKELLSDGWEYCPKSEWKEKVRDNKVEEFGTHKLTHIKTRKGKKSNKNR